MNIDFKNSNTSIQSYTVLASLKNALLNSKAENIYLKVKKRMLGKERMGHKIQLKYHLYSKFFNTGGGASRKNATFRTV